MLNLGSSWVVSSHFRSYGPHMKAPKKAPKRMLDVAVVAPIPTPVVVVPPRPTKEQPGSKPATAKSRGSKSQSNPREHPDARTKAGKATRAEIRAEVRRHVPSRLSAQQAKRTGVAPGGRAAKPKRSKGK